MHSRCRPRFLGLGIRRRLLLVMMGLLVVSALLSLCLHLQESRRARDRVSAAVDRIVAQLTAAGLVEWNGAPGGAGSAARDLAEPRVEDAARLSPHWSGLSLESFRPVLRLGPEDWTLLLEHRYEDSLLFDEPVDPRLLGPGAVLPAPSRRTLERLRDPIEEVREASLPRELAIAGSVLLVGFVLTWFLAGRLSRPLKELTERMERVARGDLTVNFAVDGAGSDEVSQMARAFNVMVERLRETREIERRVFEAERLAALGNLAAGVAHDLRNPLNTIGLGLSHLQDVYGPSEPGRREGFDRLLADARGELARLKELVRNFLALARGETGRRTPSRPGALLEETLRLLRKEAESRGVEFIAELEEVPELMLDVSGMRRAFTNLLLNALQALEDGGTVRVRLARADRGAVRVSIEDDGRGMSPDVLDKAALPYFSTRPDGTGLGLPIARGIIEAHGGSIALFSRPGNGTRVEVTLATDACSDDPRALSAARRGRPAPEEARR